MNETGVRKEVRASQGTQTGKWAIAISGTKYFEGFRTFGDSGRTQLLGRVGDAVQGQGQKLGTGVGTGGTH